MIRIATILKRTLLIVASAGFGLIAGACHHVGAGRRQDRFHWREATMNAKLTEH